MPKCTFILPPPPISLFPSFPSITHPTTHTHTQTYLLYRTRMSDVEKEPETTTTAPEAKEGGRKGRRDRENEKARQQAATTNDTVHPFSFPITHI